MTDTQTAIPRRTFLASATAPVLLGLLATVGPQFAAAQNRTPVVLITGSSTGFGRASAELLGRSGYHVVASMRDVAGRNAEHAAALTALAAAEKLRIDVVDIDVTNDGSVESGTAEALRLAGQIDVLINNAGIIIPGPVELSLDAALRQFDTNVFGQLRMLRAVAPGMRARGNGLIVHVSSGLGRLVAPTNGVYCATKAAGEALFESAAYELNPFGVEMAIVQPGEFNTQFKANGRAYWSELVSSLTEADRVRLSDYAEAVRFTELGMQDGEAGPPEAVAGVIAELLAQPRGEKPLRTPAMPPEFAQRLTAINETLEGANRGMLEGSEMRSWLTLRV